MAPMRNVFQRQPRDQWSVTDELGVIFSPCTCSHDHRTTHSFLTHDACHHPVNSLLSAIVSGSVGWEKLLLSISWQFTSNLRNLVLNFYSATLLCKEPMHPSVIQCLFWISVPNLHKHSSIGERFPWLWLRYSGTPYTAAQLSSTTRYASTRHYLWCTGWPIACVMGWDFSKTEMYQWFLSYALNFGEYLVSPLLKLSLSH